MFCGEAPKHDDLHATLQPSYVFFFFLKKLVMHIEFPDGKTFDIECIYLFTLVLVGYSQSGSHKIKAIDDFVDTAAFAQMGGASQ